MLLFLQKFVIYMPPCQKVVWIKQAEAQIFKAKQLGLEMVLLGDFNMDYLRIKEHSSWCTMMSSLDMEQVVTVPTRVTANSSTLLDHIYVSCKLEVTEVSVVQLGISDQI